MTVPANDDHRAIAGEVCRIYNEQATAALSTNLQPCDIVVLHQRSNWHSKEGTYLGKLVFYGDGGNDPNGRRATNFAHIRNLLSIVQARGASLLLLGDVPLLPERAQLCATSIAAAARCETSRATVLEQTAVERNFYSELVQADRTNSTYYMPLDELFCDPNAQAGRECGVVVPGTHTVAFLDSNHINTAGASYLWPFLCDFFTRHGLMA